jgi:hypothetical protein
MVFLPGGFCETQQHGKGKEISGFSIFLNRFFEAKSSKQIFAAVS